MSISLLIFDAPNSRAPKPIEDHSGVASMKFNLVNPPQCWRVVYMYMKKFDGVGVNCFTIRFAILCKLCSNHINTNTTLDDHFDVVFNLLQLLPAEPDIQFNNNNNDIDQIPLLFWRTSSSPETKTKEKLIIMPPPPSMSRYPSEFETPTSSCFNVDSLSTPSHRLSNVRTSLAVQHCPSHAPTPVIVVFHAPPEREYNPLTRTQTTYVTPQLNARPASSAAIPTSRKASTPSFPTSINCSSPHAASFLASSCPQFNNPPINPTLSLPNPTPGSSKCASLPAHRLTVAENTSMQRGALDEVEERM
ncbi:hypothetical protein SCHPADRAFT_947479 [Schizopora paradoxa]|uniref:Uncharacterized protein n=1 Tax=Schizopora paradoxa TaxID=27342 RepID=A0A0H2QZB7_9AGAM|nr:hypothetical protein SCHPADRAFT_947479 [Schizopora paradoxa]